MATTQALTFRSYIKISQEEARPEDLRHDPLRIPPVNTSTTVLIQ